MACGYDPEGLRPTGWSAPTTMAASGGTATMVAARPAVTATLVEDARPQEINDPDWVQHRPRRLFLQDMLSVERRHPRVLLGLLLRVGLRTQLLFARGLRDAGFVEIVLDPGCDRLRVEHQAVLL